LANKKSTEIQKAAKKSLKSFEEKQNVVDHRIKLRREDNKFALMATAIAFVVALAAQYSYFGFGPGLAKDFCVTSTTKFHATDSQLQEFSSFSVETRTVMDLEVLVIASDQSKTYLKPKKANSLLI